AGVALEFGGVGAGDGARVLRLDHLGPRGAQQVVGLVRDDELRVAARGNAGEHVAVVDVVEALDFVAEYGDGVVVLADVGGRARHGLLPREVAVPGEVHQVQVAGGHLATGQRHG